GWRWCRRNPAVAALLVTVAMTLLLGTVVSSFFAVRAAAWAAEAQGKADEARAEAIQKEEQRREAGRQRAEAERQRGLGRQEASEKERQRQRAEWEAAEKEHQRLEAERLKTRAEAETRRVKSVLKTAQLLRAEMVGRSNPHAGFLLLHDEKAWPTAERDFAWG